MAAVTVDFNAQVTRFTSGIDRMTNDLNKFQSHTQRVSRNINSILGTLGVGLSVTGLAAFAKSSIDAADRLNDLSKVTGITVENLSGLQLAAQKSGADLEGVASSIAKLSVNMGKDPDKFRKLGIDAKEPLEAFRQLSDIFVGIEDPQKRAAFAAEALGKSWQTAAPLLAEGSVEIGRMVKEGKEFSGVTTKMAQDADRLNEKLSEIMTTLGGLGTKFAVASLSMFLDNPIAELRGKIGDLERNMETRGSLIGGWIFGTQEEKQKRLDGMKSELAELERVANEARKPKTKKDTSAVDKFIGAAVDDSDAKAMEANRKEWEKFLDERRKGAQESSEMDFQQIQRWKDLADPAAKYREEIEDIKFSMSEMGGVSKEVGEANIKMLEEQIAKTNKVAVEMSDTWKTFADNTQRTLADVLYKGFNGTFNDIGEMFKQMLLRMAAEAASARIMTGIMGLFGGAAAGGAASGGTMLAAKGAWFDGSVARFAMGGVVNSPTPFRFASGGSFRNGLMGEAGPEAIIPLKRDSSGRLGVSGGGGTSINYAPIINIDARTDRAEVERIVRRAVQQGNAELVDKLQRQGAI